jgi:threonylcarbamoyladenosine tRNA methylthiotransferase MtaB
MKNNEIITFGCRLNIFESQVIKNNMQEANIENAIVFNTCAVTKEAERQALQAIRKAHKNHPEKQIIVTGCAAQLNPEKFAKLEGVTKVLGNTEKLNLEFYKSTQEIAVSDIMEARTAEDHIVTDFEGKARAYIQIQNGCNHRCTFCTIPLARGNNRSLPIGKIVEQTKILLNQGYNEIVFTGVDISDYGGDLPGKPSLAQLIRRTLNLVPDLPRLRLSSIDVAEINDELIELIKNEPRLMPHIHISVQAGDNMILKRMKRRHNREQVIEFCKDLYQARPGIAFGADIIAGFPTETDEMFLNSKNLLEEIGFAHLHVFPYSEREDTPASKMPQVAPAIRKARAKILREVGAQNLKDFLQTMIGKKTTIIYEGNNQGRTENFCVVKLSEELTPGHLYAFYIEAASDNYLTGKLL